MKQTNIKCFEIDVIIVAYNAENYIKKAIDSVLSQKTDFKFHVHVFDDCSTDNTANLVSCYKNENLTLYTSQFNFGTFGNLQKAIANCKSTFVALLEGDDYWNDENKLQEQIDFLITNPNYAGCAANSLIFDQTANSFKGLYNHALKIEYTLPELFSVPPFQIGTLVYRREFLPTIPNEFKNTISNDKVVYTLLARLGNIFCINKPFSVYRKHNQSISNSEKTDFIYSKQKLLYGIMRKQFDREYHSFINEALYIHLKGYMIGMANEGIPLKNIFPEFLYQWLMLNKWLSLNGCKDLYYFIRKIF